MAGVVSGWFAIFDAIQVTCDSSKNFVELQINLNFYYKAEMFASKLKNDLLNKFCGNVIKNYMSVDAYSIPGDVPWRRYSEVISKAVLYATL